MSKSALLYLETATITVVTLLPLHYLAGISWPRALTIGLVAAIVVRAIIHHRQRPKGVGTQLPR
jgi:hypothetical protein